MRMKLVKRYWCDHCNKAGLSSRSMITHEKHCTLNPNRSCRVCNLLNGIGHGHYISELLDMLPDPTAYLAQGFYYCNCFPAYDGEQYRDDCTNEYAKLERALKEVMPKLREAVADCPACIMAALRQKKIPVPMVEGFDFKNEMQAVFNQVNENRDDNYH